MLTLPSAWRISPASIAVPSLRSKPSTNCRVAGGAAEEGWRRLLPLRCASRGGSTAGGCSAADLGSRTAAAGGSSSGFCSGAGGYGRLLGFANWHGGIMGGSLNGFCAGAGSNGRLAAGFCAGAGAAAAQLPAFAWAGRPEPFLPLGFDAATAGAAGGAGGQSCFAATAGAFAAAVPEGAGGGAMSCFRPDPLGEGPASAGCPGLALGDRLAGVRRFRRPRLSP